MKMCQPPAFAGRSLVAVVLGLVLAMGGLFAQQGGGIPLNPDHPDRYVVRPGDTLWDISAQFLRDPWYWPEIWYVNPQVENPHLIYPGDVLTLVYLDGQPRVQLERGPVAGAERLSPRIREQPLADAIPALPLDVVGPFLSRGTVLQKDEIKKLPYVMALRDDHLVGAAGNDLYVRGDGLAVNTAYSLVRVGVELRDPDDGDLLGYEGLFVGEGTIRRGGDPATLKVNSSAREALKGDRLMSAAERPPLVFYPQAPAQPVDGRIVHVVDGVSRIGQYQIVVLNRGTRHGLMPGHVLSVWQAGQKVVDEHGPGLLNEKVQLPDELAGNVMIFRTFDRLSYALVVRAVAPMHTLDKVTNPTAS